MTWGYRLGVPTLVTKIAMLDSNKTKENMLFTHGDITIKNDDITYITTNHNNDTNINKGFSEKLK